VNVAIDIPDEIGQVLAAQAGGASRAVLEAVATARCVKSYACYCGSARGR